MEAEEETGRQKRLMWLDGSIAVCTPQRIDGPFEVNAARAFHQNNVAGLEILPEPAAGGLGVGQKQRGDSASAAAAKCSALP